MRSAWAIVGLAVIAPGWRAASAVPPPPAACISPAAYGAFPGDGVDDRVGIQAAWDAASGGGVVCLSPGRYEVTRAPVGSYNRTAALSAHTPDSTLTGAGATIALVGDQGFGASSVISLDPGAARVTISGVTIDTASAFNTDEQTHAVQIGSGFCAGAACVPVTDIRLTDVRFVHPKLTGRKGDCVRLLGATAATEVRRVTIQGGSFISCARSGVAIQRNVADVVINGNQFFSSNDQDIDSEPTGTGTNRGLVITSNVFHDVNSQGDYAVTIGGASTPMAQVTVVGNTFSGRGLFGYRVVDSVISGNTFHAQMASPGGVLDFRNVMTGTAISGNVVRRTGVPGPGIRITPQSGGFPARFVVAGNQVTNDTAGGVGLYLESATDFAVTGNGLDTAGGSSVVVRSITGTTRGVISGNRGTGTIGVFAAPGDIGDMNIETNLVPAVVCGATSPGAFTGMVTGC